MFTSIRKVEAFDGNFRLALIFVCFSLAITSYSCGSDGEGGVQGDNADFQIANSIETIIEDMELPHEALPHGVPLGWSWAEEPVVDFGNQPPQNFTAMTAWGQVYEAIEGNPATNTRVHIWDIRAYVLSKADGKWHLLQSSAGVLGASFLENYAGDISIAGDKRNEADGGISIKAGQGYNFHFWPPQRVDIDPNDIAGVFTTVQARLVLDDPNLPDDRNQARYLLNMGGDYWIDTDVGWENWTTNYGIAMGRFKFVGHEWQSFNMITLSGDEVRGNPPPIQ